MKTRGKQKWIPSEEIEGLDVPMIHPVPEGYVQDWDSSTRRWRLMKRRYPPTSSSLMSLLEYDELD